MKNKTYSRYFDYGDPSYNGFGLLASSYAGPCRINGIACIVVHREDDFYVTFKSYGQWLNAIG